MKNGFKFYTPKVKHKVINLRPNSRILLGCLEFRVKIILFGAFLPKMAKLSFKPINFFAVVRTTYFEQENYSLEFLKKIVIE